MVVLSVKFWDMFPDLSAAASPFEPESDPSGPIVGSTALESASSHWVIVRNRAGYLILIIDVSTIDWKLWKFSREKAGLRSEIVGQQFYTQTDLKLSHVLKHQGHPACISNPGFGPIATQKMPLSCFLNYRL